MAVTAEKSPVMSSRKCKDASVDIAARPFADRKLS